MFKDQLVYTDQLTIIAKNAGAGIIGKLYFNFIRFIVAILIMRTIGPGYFGIYLLGLSIVQILVVFVPFGLEFAMIKFVAHNMAKRELAI